MASVAYPAPYESFLGHIDVVNLDLAWMLSAGCLIGAGVHDQPFRLDDRATARSIAE